MCTTYIANRVVVAEMVAELGKKKDVIYEHVFRSLLNNGVVANIIQQVYQCTETFLLPIGFLREVD